jgi:hypothetical protein
MHFISLSLSPWSRFSFSPPQKLCFQIQGGLTEPFPLVASPLDLVTVSIFVEGAVSAWAFRRRTFHHSWVQARVLHRANLFLSTCCYIFSRAPVFLEVSGIVRQGKKNGTGRKYNPFCIYVDGYSCFLVSSTFN